MKRFVLELTEELLAAIDKALKERSGTTRNAAIEEWLWRIGEIKQAAKKGGIQRSKRPTRGRPKKQVD